MRFTGWDLLANSTDSRAYMNKCFHRPDLREVAHLWKNQGNLITKNILKSVFGMASLHFGEEELTFYRMTEF